MASCLPIIHCGNLVQMAKSCKVTVDGPDRRYFIPRLAELRVPHWALQTSHCGCGVAWVPGAHNNKYRSYLRMRNFLLGGCVHQAWPRLTTWLLVHMMCKSFVYRPWWSQLQISFTNELSGWAHNLWTFVHFLLSKIEPSAVIFKTKPDQIHLSELADIKASSEVPGGAICATWLWVAWEQPRGVWERKQAATSLLRNPISSELPR